MSETAARTNVTETQSAKIYAVVPAAGVGTRMGASQPKQYLSVLGKTVMEHTLEKLLSEQRIEKIVVALSKEDQYWKSLNVFNNSRIDVTEGGKERADSVHNGLNFLASVCQPNDWVLVHDVARPCLPLNDLGKLIDQLQDDSVGGILAIPVSDTIKQVDGDSISDTVDRSRLWHALTPQMFRFDVLRQALEKGVGVFDITDEASAVEFAGFKPRVVEGDRCNIKITRPDDLALAEYYLSRT